ncbi:MAG: hypothetical protein ACR2HG_02710 [Pyrinomonadaceae bacterium]
MLRKITLILISFLIAANLACSTTENANVNANNAGATNQTNPANVPPEFSTNTLPMNGGATPGIPNPNDPNANKVPTGNIPGIPNNTNSLGKTPQPKKTPPIPGIPDDETIRRQMNTPLKDVNVVNNPPKTQSNANDKPANKRGNRNQ